MMELLLLSGADSEDSEVMDLAVKARSMEATIMLLNWERVGKGEGESSQPVQQLPHTKLNSCCGSQRMTPSGFSRCHWRKRQIGSTRIYLNLRIPNL